MHKYEPVRCLGRGSYGSATLVHLRSDRSKHFVAKEVLVGHLPAAGQEAAKREAEVLAQLSHSNVIMYVESFVEGPSLFIIMDYADGGDLASAIARRKEKQNPFTEREVMNIFVQICLALRHIHAQNILHRDLKSGNVFLTSKGLVKLGDFGIAKTLDGTDDCAQTQIGTPYYLSPEVCENQPYGKKTDIWSLGIILYELITLELPFQAQSLPALIFKICTAEYPPIPPDKCSPELIELVGQLLQKDERNRPTVTEILKQQYVQTHISKLLSYTIKSGAGGAENDAHKPSQDAVRPPAIPANQRRQPKPVEQPRISQDEADRRREEEKAKLKRFREQRALKQKQMSRESSAEPSPRDALDRQVTQHHVSPQGMDAREVFFQNRAAANAYKQRAIAELHASPVPWSVNETDDEPLDDREDRDNVSQQRTQQIAEVTRQVYFSNRAAAAEIKRKVEMDLHGYSDSHTSTTRVHRADEDDDGVSRAERVKKQLQLKKQQEQQEYARELEAARMQARLDRKRIEARLAELPEGVCVIDDNSPARVARDRSDSSPVDVVESPASATSQKAVAFDIQFDQPRATRKPPRLEQKLLSHNRHKRAAPPADADERRVLEGMNKRRGSAAEIRAETRSAIARLRQQRAKKREAVVRRVNLDEMAAPCSADRSSSPAEEERDDLEQWLESHSNNGKAGKNSRNHGSAVQKTELMRAFEQDVESLLEAPDEADEEQEDSEDDTEVQALQCSLARALMDDEPEAEDTLDLK